jgi:hypothetical protein
MVLRGHIPSLRPGLSFLAASLLATGAVLATAADSRLAVSTHSGWAWAWTTAGVFCVAACLRAYGGSIPTLGSASAPLWLAAGVAGAAVLGSHSLDVLAASGIPLDLDAEVMPFLPQGDAMLLGVLWVPVCIVWLFKGDRGGTPPIRTLSLLGLSLLGTILVSVLLDADPRSFKAVRSVPTTAMTMTLLPLGWMLVAFAFDGSRSRVLRGPSLLGILLGGAMGFVVLPTITVMLRPIGLRSLGDRGLFELLVGRGLGNHAGEIASGMEAALCAIAGSALLVLCMRNAIYGWRILPGIAALFLPIAAVIVQARLPSDSITLAALVLGWAAVVVGVPFSGRVVGGEQ